MKEEKQKTLTLTLPFVDFKGTDKESTDASSYKSDGTFFVRNRQGYHEIVCVVKSKNEAWANPLPPTVSEEFFFQDVEQEQADKFKELNDRLSTFHNHFFESMSREFSIIKTEIKNEISKGTAEIETLAETKREEYEKASGGYVDQDVLLQIIKEVKK